MQIVWKTPEQGAAKRPPLTGLREALLDSDGIARSADVNERGDQQLAVAAVNALSILLELANEALAARQVHLKPS